MPPSLQVDKFQMFIIALLLMFSDRLNIRILHKLIEISKIMKDISVRPARAPELKKKKNFYFHFKWSKGFFMTDHKMG